LHVIYIMVMNEVTLYASDDKRYVCEDGISTLAWGRYKIPRKRAHEEAFSDDEDDNAWNITRFY
jgi:hypothetical protein